MAACHISYTNPVQALFAGDPAVQAAVPGSQGAPHHNCSAVRGKSGCFACKCAALKCGAFFCATRRAVCPVAPPNHTLDQSTASPSCSLSARLAQQPKVEMEAHLARALPSERRHGCTIVFRRGSPLNAASLDLVSVSTAGSIIVSGGLPHNSACCAACDHTASSCMSIFHYPLSPTCRRLQPHPGRQRRPGGAHSNTGG